MLGGASDLGPRNFMPCALPPPNAPTVHGLKLLNVSSFVLAHVASGVSRFVFEFELSMRREGTFALNFYHQASEIQP